MIAPARISPPPPLQGTPPSHGPSIRNGSAQGLALFPDLAAPPAPRGASGRTDERKWKEEREGKGVSSATTDDAPWSARGLSVNDPRSFQNSNSYKSAYDLHLLPHSPRVISAAAMRTVLHSSPTAANASPPLHCDPAPDFRPGKRACSRISLGAVLKRVAVCLGYAPPAPLMLQRPLRSRDPIINRHISSPTSQKRRTKRGGRVQH